MLIAGLKDGTIKIYDVRSHQEIFKISDYKGGELGNISFSNKGLNFAAAWKSSDTCRVFNLKRLGKEVFELKHSAGNVNFVNFDFFGGSLLTAAGSSLNIYQATKKWDEPAVYTNERAHDTGIVNLAKFSPSGRFIVSAGNEDRFMNVFGL
jgi:WD40 repeat protein